MKDNLGNKSLEIKHIKSDLENIKKEKNVISVALHASKADVREQKKEFERKKIELEKKLEKLNDYRKEKLEEERKEKIRKKKESKKSKNQMQDYPNNKFKTELTDIKELNSEPDNDVDKMVKEDIFAETHEHKESEEILKLETEDDKILQAEDHEDFIGPKLPRMMIKAEVEEFQRELFAKWDLQLKTHGIL